MRNLANANTVILHCLKWCTGARAFGRFYIIRAVLFHDASSDVPFQMIIYSQLPDRFGGMFPFNWIMVQTGSLQLGHTWKRRKIRGFDRGCLHFPPEEFSLMRIEVGLWRAGCMQGHGVMASGIDRAGWERFSKIVKNQCKFENLIQRNQVILM